MSVILFNFVLDMNSNILRYIAILPTLAAVSCFTGVESTPKISYSDVKKEKIVVTPEERFLQDVTYECPLDWKKGKTFHDADTKISIIFASSASTLNNENLMDQDLIFDAIYPVPSLSGEDVTEIKLLTPSGKSLYYKDLTKYSELKDRPRLEIPFTIENSMVNQVRERLLGNTYYIITPLWYSADGEQAVNGLRHIPIKVDSVLTGNAVYPIRIVFTPEEETKQYSLYMTIGDSRSSTRNFHTLFAFDNPKVKYPGIKDEMWQLIRHSQVKDGMTRQECRLALGSPTTIGQRPTTVGMVEYWQYPDGKYLLFEDGLLSKYRQ